MFGLGLIPILEGPFHLAVAVVFDALILAMFIWMLLSWFMMMVPISPGNRFVRFIDAMIAPVIDPIRKRMPSTSMGMLNLGYTIAFIFAWWALRMLALVMLLAIPNGW